ncbi:MAG: alpha-amylase family glycosyl hydrolase, partial [Chloroflexota bacterium]
PSSWDDGFSVIDYRTVDPAFGDWKDVARFCPHFRLMFDAVINHVSARSAWFQAFLRDDPAYRDYFIVVPDGTDLSKVCRPRPGLPLTCYPTPGGEKAVWTTFSANQIDLNYQHPQVLLEIIDVLLFYVAQGAEFIRLDAIAYLWKEIGTPCIHLPQTHQVVQLFRTILDIVAPQVMLITETNVPHRENISYFKDGAQLVYQFSLAPLVLHTFRAGNAEALQSWVAGLEKLPSTATFFNFIASHDGIGVRPAEGILTPAEMQALADQTLTHGGHVSYKTNPDGSQSVYELNITLFDVLSDPKSREPEGVKIDRFMTSQAMMLALAGVPGIYVHSLVGSPNHHAGVTETGRARTINREKWRRVDLEAALNNPNARAARVFNRYVALLKARAAHSAFHPDGQQRVITGNPAIFNLLRTSPDGRERVLCVHNITDQTQQLEINVSNLALAETLQDILLAEKMETQNQVLHLTLAPYEMRWLAG